jgi:hypothetical protein
MPKVRDHPGHQGKNIADQTSGSREGIHERYEEVMGVSTMFFVVVRERNCTGGRTVMWGKLLMELGVGAGLAGASLILC